MYCNLPRTHLGHHGVTKPPNFARECPHPQQFDRDRDAADTHHFVGALIGREGGGGPLAQRLAGDFWGLKPVVYP